MTEDEARIGYWKAIDLLRDWIECGPDSKEEVIEEVIEELKDNL